MGLRAGLWLVLLAAFFYLWGLGAVGFQDPDEGMCAEIARAMRASRDSVVPTFLVFLVSFLTLWALVRRDGGLCAGPGPCGVLAARRALCRNSMDFRRGVPYIRLVEPLCVSRHS